MKHLVWSGHAVSVRPLLLACLRADAAKSHQWGSIQTPGEKRWASLDSGALSLHP